MNIIAIIHTLNIMTTILSIAVLNYIDYWSFSLRNVFYTNENFSGAVPSSIENTGCILVPDALKRTSERRLGSAPRITSFPVPPCFYPQSAVTVIRQASDNEIATSHTSARMSWRGSSTIEGTVLSPQKHNALIAVNYTRNYVFIIPLCFVRVKQSVWSYPFECLRLN